MSVDGTWNITMTTPLGEQKIKLTLQTEGNILKGTLEGSAGSTPLTDGTISGNSVSGKAHVTSPIAITLEFSGTVDGNNISGNVKLGAFGSTTFSGTRA